ncbi:MAG: hypothetical protein GXO32_06705 [Crenarchaeota archaeon]|nr:hypothetical protein [Thermoproteota archaeon]
MRCLIQDLEDIHDTESRILDVVSRRCVWNIVKVLGSTKSKMMNITALVSALRANYDYVMKCLNIMESYGMVEIAKIGRLRLVKLNTSNELVAKMISLLLSEG